MEPLAIGLLHETSARWSWRSTSTRLSMVIEERIEEERRTTSPGRVRRILRLRRRHPTDSALQPRSKGIESLAEDTRKPLEIRTDPAREPRLPDSSRSGTSRAAGRRPITALVAQMLSGVVQLSRTGPSARPGI